MRYHLVPLLADPSRLDECAQVGAMHLSWSSLTYDAAPGLIWFLDIKAIEDLRYQLIKCKDSSARRFCYISSGLGYWQLYVGLGRLNH